MKRHCRVRSLYTICCCRVGDDNFKVTKTYTTEKPSLGVYTKNDDFLTPTWHGRYVKVRANYGYGVHGKWSEKKMIGCGKLHLHQDFVNGPFDD